MNQFYTYLWLREDGTPYYVGKGHDNRAFRKGSPSPDRVMLQEFPCEEDSFFAERFLIALYGRKDLGTGILINRTDGGQGAAGKKVSSETRKRLSIAMTGVKFSPAACAHLSKLRAGKKHKPCSAETKAKIAAALVGKKHSQERIQHIREGRWRNYGR